MRTIFCLNRSQARRMETVFKMPDEWLYIEDGDDRFHARLMEAKKNSSSLQNERAGTDLSARTIYSAGRISLRLPRQDPAYDRVCYRPDRTKNNEGSLTRLAWERRCIASRVFKDRRHFCSAAPTKQVSGRIDSGRSELGVLLCVSAGFVHRVLCFVRANLGSGCCAEIDIDTLADQ